MRISERCVFSKPEREGGRRSASHGRRRKQDRQLGLFFKSLISLWATPQKTSESEFWKEGRETLGIMGDDLLKNEKQIWKHTELSLCVSLSLSWRRSTPSSQPNSRTMLNLWNTCVTTSAHSRVWITERSSNLPSKTLGCLTWLTVWGTRTVQRHLKVGDLFWQLIGSALGLIYCHYYEYDMNLMINVE